MITISNLKPQKCGRCGSLLARDYPYELCPDCWQEKFHAPPGYNYFPEGEAAANLSREAPFTNTTYIRPSRQRESSHDLSGGAEELRS